MLACAFAIVVAYEGNSFEIRDKSLAAAINERFEAASAVGNNLTLGDGKVLISHQ